MKTLYDSLTAFADYARSLNLSEETIACRKKQLLLFLNWLEVRYRITTPDRLSRRHLRAYQLHLSRHRTRKGAPLKPGTINNRVKSLRAWLAFLAAEGLVRKDLFNAIVYVKEPKLLPTTVLDHAEVRRLFRRIDTSTAMGYRDRTVLELLYSTGMRRGELLGLTLDAVDLDQAVVRVHGKGDKERLLPVGRTAMRFLQSYMTAIRPFWPGAGGTDAVFLTKYGKPFTAAAMKKLVKRHCGSASVKVTTHTFRRSCTTELVRGDANLYHVKELLGHASLDSLKAYTKLNINDLRKTHAKCHPREKDEKRERG